MEREEGMMEDNRLACKCQYPNDAPIEIQKIYRARAEDEFKKGLIGYLWEHRDKRLCVSIKEKTDDCYTYSVYAVYCDVTAVQEYPIGFTMPTFEDMSWKSLSGSAIAEIRQRIRKWFAGDK